MGDTFIVVGVFLVGVLVGSAVASRNYMSAVNIQRASIKMLEDEIESMEANE